MRNDVDDIKWKIIKYLLEDKVVDEIKKSIEEAIWYIVDRPNFFKNWNLTYFKSLVKNNAQNEVFNLKQFADNVPPTPKVGKVVTPQVANAGIA